MHLTRPAVYRSLFTLALLIALGAPTGGVEAAWRSYWIEDFSSTIEVRRDGVIEVTESIRFYFEGSYNGIFRDIPLRYSDNAGFNYRLRLHVVAVTDDLGSPLRYELESADGGGRRIRVYVPGAQDAARTVRISYRVERALRFFPEHDELYWNVTGTDWGVPIRAASARVVLPSGLEDPLQATAFVGRYGSRGDAWRSRVTANNEVSFETTEELAYGEGLTVVVGWAKGAVPEPSVADEAGFLLRDNWPLGIPALVLLLMIMVWRTYGRDPETGRSIMPMYHPPVGMSPAELGALIDERVDQRDIVATVVDLAVRGYLRIEETEVSGWFTQSTKTAFRKLAPADDRLRPHELEVFEGIFEGGDRVELDDLENEFYTRLGTIRTNVYKGLVGAGYFRNSPQNVRRAWVVIGVLVIAAAMPAAAAKGSVAGAIAAVASGVIVLSFAWFMPARTMSGRHKWIEVKGFEEFLGRTEGERLRELEVDVGKFEAYLPFAMALGVAEKWGKAFDGLLERAPQWYIGPGHAHFSAAMFSRRMNAVSTSVGTAMATAPRSSSSGSSGFSGGSSGGGFGGGGGGAF